MKRIQLFEFEDFHWLPNFIRNSLTHLIVVFHRLMGTHALLANLLRRIQQEHPYRQIVDLGSGSGGPMPEVVQLLNQELEQPVQLLLTDLHPNPMIIKELEAQQTPNVSYQKSSLNAAQLDKAPKGLRTMLNSFHHIPPASAKAILKSAQDSGEPLLIYELSENKAPTLLWWLLLPISLPLVALMCLLMTPFARPLTWKQLLFTYIIPIIPIVYAWDGQASYIRMYAFSDLEMMLADIKDPNYTWEIAPAKTAKGKSLGYYVLGMPKTLIKT